MRRLAETNVQVSNSYFKSKNDLSLITSMFENYFAMDMNKRRFPFKETTKRIYVRRNDLCIEAHMYDLMNI